MHTLCVVAGKSGGHIVPGLTLAHQKQSNNPNLRILFFTTPSSLDKKIISNTSLNNLKHFTLPLDAIPYRKPWKIPLFFYAFIYALFICCIYLYRYKPSQIISMGGIISLPVCLAGFVLRIPIALYELNAVPGSAVKFLARFATTIPICFDDARNHLPQQKCTLTDYPIRYSTKQCELNRHEVRKNLGISVSKKTILILGGSQGSQFINNMIKQLFESNPWLASHLHAIHQTGIDKSTDWPAWYCQHNVSAHTFAYHDDLSMYYRAADLVICRAGAGSLFETLFFKLPLITIPLETHTTDHQIYNARAVEKQYPELVYVLVQKNIEHNPVLLLHELCSILTINLEAKAASVNCIDTL